MDDPYPPGICVTRRPPHLAYWVIPKCGCSSIMQVIHYLDNGEFFAGDIHERPGPLLTSATPEGRAELGRKPASDVPFGFTLARNPFRRLASCFADKIVGFPAKGRRYRLGEVHEQLAAYGVEWGPKANIVANFRAFVRFAADTIVRGRPMPPDRHWLPAIAHLQNASVQHPAWTLNFVGHVENFTRDMDKVYRMAGVKSRRMPQSVPRANESYLYDVPLTALYGPEEIRIVQDVYADDFRLFRYSGRLDQPKPVGAIDLAEVGAELGRAPAEAAG